LQSARDLALEANNASLTTSQRQDIATQLTQQLQHLVGISNRTDSNGNYLFSGHASSTQPFSQNGNSVSYMGADQVSQVQISENQRISAGDTGSSVFMNLPAGNGTFTIAFTDATDYTVTNSSGTNVASGTYDATTGGTISFNGIQVTLSGNPATNDTFTVAPAGQASAFATLSGLITTLSSTTLNAGQTVTQISQAIEQIDGALNNLGDVSASVGGRLNAVTASLSSAQSRQTNLKSSISDISSTDYAAATTQLSSEEIAL